MDYQIPMVPTTDANAEIVSPLKTENSYYIHNYDGVSAAGVMSMTVHYELQENSQVMPASIVVHIYDFADLQENTLTLDGNICSNYTYDEITGRLTVPVEAASGTLRFCLKPLRYEALTSYARLVYTDAYGNEAVEVIGSVNSLMPALNISARKETALSYVEVMGVAVPETEVALYVDGVFAKKINANKAGDYSTVVELKDPADGKTYTIMAESADHDGKTVTVQTNVLYRETAPELKDFWMHHSGTKVSLLELQGVRPVITFVPNKNFRFEVDFLNSEALSDVFIVSTRNNVKKHLKAEWNEELGLFVAEGFFDPMDQSYVPGAISIEYIAKGKRLSFDSGYDYTSPEAYEALPQVMKDADIKVKENNAGNITADVTLGEADKQISYELSVKTEAIPDRIDENKLEEYGFIKMTDDAGKTLYIRYTYGNDGSAGILKEYGKPAKRDGVLGSTEEGQQCIQIEIADFWSGQIESLVIDNIHDAIGDALGIGVLFDVLGVTDYYDAEIEGNKEIEELNKLRNEVNKDPTISAADKKEFSQAVDSAIASIESMIAFKQTLTGVDVAGIFFPVLGAGTAVLGFIADANILLAKINVLAVGYGVPYAFKWAIDPSGYVYDELTGERLEDVTVHAYWIENPSDDPDFWEKKPGEDEYGVLWDSMEFSQMNPLLTDAEGRYAWDVPEGWWRVSYEKEGYESAWSQWLPVPPPQTEVNIGLMPIGGAILGDLTGDGFVDNLDVEYLLWYTLFPEEYSINQRADFNHDNSIDNLDVECLLWYTLFPEEYPLSK